MPKRFLCEPIEEIFEAARLLDAAVDAHLEGDFQKADQLIREADKPVIAEWTDALWGARSPEIHRLYPIAEPLPVFPIEQRPRPRMPTAAIKHEVRSRDGHHCRFCGIPVIEDATRVRIKSHYPNALRWGRSNSTQHAAFQCMWLQYDHVLPNSRGGQTTLENVVVTCAPCNYARMENTLDEMDLLDPRERDYQPSWNGYHTWDGLVRFC